MQAGTYNIKTTQGATDSLATRFENDDGSVVVLTGYTAKMQVRKSATDPDEPVITLTTENGGITIGGSAGTVTLNWFPADTEDVDAGYYVYDIELYSGPVVTPYLRGEFELIAEVTE